MMIRHFVFVHFSLTKPKQTVRAVIQDIDAFLEELLDEEEDGGHRSAQANSLLRVTSAVRFDSR